MHRSLSLKKQRLSINTQAQARKDFDYFSMGLEMLKDDMTQGEKRINMFLDTLGVNQVSIQDYINDKSDIKQHLTTLKS